MNSNLIRIPLFAGLVLAPTVAMAQPNTTQGNAVGDLVSKCGANVPIFGTGTAGTVSLLSCLGTLQIGQGGTGLTSLGTGVQSALGQNTNTANGLIVPSGLGSVACVNSIIINGSGVPGTGACPGTAGNIAVGTTTISAGTNGRILYDNSGVLGEATVTGTLGNVVLSSSPTISTPTISGHFTAEGVTTTGATGTGNVVFASSPSISALTVTSSFTATGLVTNGDLVNSSITIGSTAISLGSSASTIGGNLTFSGSTIQFNGNINGSETITMAQAGNGTNTGAQFGSAVGTSTTRSTTNTGILLYNNSTSNWAGIGADTGGSMDFVISNPPAAGWFWVTETSAGVSSSVANLSTGGGLTVAGCTGCTSDARLKKDFRTLTCKDVSRVYDLQPGSFQWRHVAQLPDRKGSLHYGVIAQKAEKDFPELVYRDVATDLTPDGMYLFNYEEMIPVLIKAVQCLKMELAKK